MVYLQMIRTYLTFDEAIINCQISAPCGPNVIGRKNWLFSVSEAGAKANATCLSLAETSKANGIDFYQYLVKLLTELPTLSIHQQPDLLHNYMPWSENIQATCAK